jgi:hypothetical protein
LFGLGGSLVLGFIDIQASHAQNRFFNDMEEWLSGVTQLVDSSDDSDMEGKISEPGVARIEHDLERLIGEIRNNQQSLEQLIKIYNTRTDMEKKQT